MTPRGRRSRTSSRPATRCDARPPADRGMRGMADATFDLLSQQIRAQVRHKTDPEVLFMSPLKFPLQYLTRKLRTVYFLLCPPYQTIHCGHASVPSTRARALEDLLWGIYFNYKIGRGRKAGALFKLDGAARAHIVGRTDAVCKIRVLALFADF